MRTCSSACRVWSRSSRNSKNVGDQGTPGWQSWIRNCVPGGIPAVGHQQRFLHRSEPVQESLGAGVQSSNRFLIASYSRPQPQRFPTSPDSNGASLHRLPLFIPFSSTEADPVGSKSLIVCAIRSLILTGRRRAPEPDCKATLVLLVFLGASQAKCPSECPPWRCAPPAGSIIQADSVILLRADLAGADTSGVVTGCGLL